MSIAKVSTKFVSHLDKVQRAIDRKHKRVLFRTGGFARKVVQQSMRPGGKKGKKSAPGEPPRYHTKLLRRGIRFGVDSRKMNVEVYAVALRDLGGLKQTTHAHGAELLEYGGHAVTRPVRLRRSGRKVGRPRRIKVEPRPYIRRKKHVDAYHDAMNKFMKTQPLR